MIADLHHRLALLALLTAAFSNASWPVYQALASDAFYDYPATKLNGETSAIFEAPVERCQKICADRSGCSGFDYSETERACRLFVSIGSANQQAAFSAATKSLINGYRPPVNLPQSTPPPERPGWYLGTYGNLDLYGGDLYPKGLAIATEYECARSCETDMRCDGYTYNTQQHRCFLKKGYSFAQIANSAKSGRFFKTVPSLSNSAGNVTVRWELFVAQDIPGHDLMEASARTYDGCVAACDSTVGCGGLTWVTFSTPDHCYLKFGDQLYPSFPRSPHQGLASARRTNRIVTADAVVQVAPRD